MAIPSNSGVKGKRTRYTEPIRFWKRDQQNDAGPAQMGPPRWLHTKRPRRPREQAPLPCLRGR